MIIKVNWLIRFPTNFIVAVALTTLAFMALPPLALAEDGITQVNFTTPAQTIKPNEVSAVITIQTQNNSGEAEKLSETADVTLELTSSTGEFSSNNTNWEPVTQLTMNRNTSNRNFYYRDSTEGSFVVKATVTTRESQRSWSASQALVVSTTGGDDGGDSNDDGEDGGDDNGDSGHSGQSDLSSVPESATFSVGAGRPRLTTIGAPVTFKALTTSGEVAAGSRFEWSFGDGASRGGEQVEHTYQFPGTYVVVVNAYRGTEQAVARTTVRVIDPQLQIKAIEPRYRSYIEIFNPSADEVNLMSWRLYAGDQYFVFPVDTILPAKASVKYPLSSMRLPLESAAELTLKYPNGWEAVAGALASPPEPTTPQQFVALATQLSQIQAAALRLKRAGLAAPALAQQPPINTPTPAVAARASLAVEPVVNSQPSSTVIELAKPTTLWRRSWSLIAELLTP